MNNTLLIARNEFEGIASAILINTIKNNNLDIEFYKYDHNNFKYEKEYNKVFIIGLKNAKNIKIKAEEIVIFNSFQEVYDYFYNNYSNKFQIYKQLNVLCKHTNAYLDWTWKDKKMYYGKNIDELSKYFNKTTLVRNITNKILNYKDIMNKEDIISEAEKQLIVFSKKIMTNYINKKNYFVIENNKYKYVCAFCEVYEIELANKMLETTGADIAILVNLNNNIVRIKSANKNEFEDKILNANGHINSNGGTLKLNDNVAKQIRNLAFNSIIETLEGGKDNEC